MVVYIIIFGFVKQSKYLSNGPGNANGDERCGYLNAVNSSSQASTRKVFKTFNRNRWEVFAFTMVNHSPAIHITEQKMHKYLKEIIMLYLYI